ncbi:EGF-like domain-containing protein [Caenorhabditis elegans]|uniref:EGF-like domain-containing protein n=1 Tax=Caenorhabditis elegans TaxID=6239 RepID=Q2PJ78_CAEEL|nr:EGF-like domain-containing protein [Caenorhabditis elegans]CAJ55249.1 EGF-like domain-containing protein [Caenorhabditis elegans]|eukprot:NP_001040731.1 Uncharacterized protein CELE_C05D12.3 [Caenorhabditis elegans]
MRILLLLGATFFFSVSINAYEQCENGGTPINSTACQCPAFVAGERCEIVKCQRWGIPDKDRCVCAPGWYDKYCGIRGCRPPNEGNLDNSKRSIIIVFNMKSSMAEQLETLRSNFKGMVNSITQNWNKNKESENWIANFMFYGFVQQGQQLTITKNFTESLDEFLNFLGSLKLQDGDTSQPVLAAVKNAQQTFPLTKSHSIVLVFTDSPASDATPWSHRFEDKNLEQLCLQISFLWRSKVSFILSLPSGTDSSVDGVDVYRRLSMSTHGDYLNANNAEEVKNILTTVISTYFFPENVGVGFGIETVTSIEPTADNINDWVFTLFTKDFGSKYELPEVAGATLISKGKNYKLVAGQNMKVVNITSVAGPYNYRTYLQSKHTLLFDYNSDMMIDVGNGIVHLGVTMHSTIRTFGFPEFQSMSYHITQANDKLVREAYMAFKRPQEDCTFEWAFDPWVNTIECPPGPITQVHLLNYDGYYKGRVTPGYCDEIAHYSPQIQGNIVPDVQRNFVFDHSRAITQSCPVTNINAINDPRLESPNQFIFILEQHSGNKNIYTTLAAEIEKIVNLTNPVTDSSYQKEFTLIVFNDVKSRVMFSAYNPLNFIKSFRTVINELEYVNQLESSLGLLSIVQAQKQNIKPVSQVYYFTNQATKTVAQVNRGWDIIDRNIEFNFFTIADGVTTEIFSLPTELNLVQKMSNGRLVTLGSNEKTLVNLFADIMTMNALTTDNQNYDCHLAPYINNAFVEKNSAATVFQFIGTGIKDISITDASGKSVSVDSNTRFQNGNFKSINIDSSTYTPGTWKVSVSTSSGGCQLSVRQKSATGVILGFTKTNDLDIVNSQIPIQRSLSSDNSPMYVPIRIRQQKDLEIKLNYQLEIQLVDTSRYDQPISYQNTTILSRDSSTCSYNYITPQITIPRNDVTSWILTSYDDENNLILRRIVYYYQHSPADTSVCHGEQVDKYGQCVCPERYTGEYCWDRICASGATLSYGICSCSSGFYEPLATSH